MKKQQDKLSTKLLQSTSSSSSLQQQQQSLIKQSNQTLLVTQHQSMPLKNNSQFGTPNSSDNRAQQANSTKSNTIPQVSNQTGDSQSQSSQLTLNNIVIGDHQKNLIKKTLQKNANKPQTKALLEKIINSTKSQNGGNRGAIGFLNSNTSSSSLAQSQQVLSISSKDSQPLQINGFGGEQFAGVNIKKTQPEGKFIEQKNGLNNQASIMNSTVSSSQSNAFQQNSVQSNQNSTNMMLVKGKAHLKKKVNLEYACLANQSSILHSQQTSYRSNSNNQAAKVISRSSSVHKLRDTMYRFTMYQPKDDQVLKEPMQIIGDSKPFHKDNASGVATQQNSNSSKIVKIKGTTVTQLISNNISQGSRPSIPLAGAVSSNNGQKQISKIRLALADQVRQQNEKLKKQQVQLSSKKVLVAPIEIKNVKTSALMQSEDEYEVDMDHVQEEVENSGFVEGNESARSTQDFFFSKNKQEQKKAAKINGHASTNATDTTMTTMQSYNNTINSNKQNNNNLSRLQYPPKQAKSTNFIFTFNNADEDIIKNAGSRALAAKHDSEAISKNLSSNNMMTPQSMGTTATNTANSGLNLQKRSIFRENPSKLKPSSIEGRSENFNHHFQQNKFGSSDKILLSNPASPKDTDEQKFKSALNKFMDMRISSPNFLNQNKIQDLNVISSSSSQKNQLQLQNQNSVHSDIRMQQPPSAMREYCESTINGQQFKNQPRFSYSQLMMQTFSKIPTNQHLPIQKGVSPRNSFPRNSYEDGGTDNDSIGDQKSPSLNQILMLSKQNSHNTPTGGSIYQYQQRNSSQNIPIIPQIQQSHTILPSIRSHTNNSDLHMTPISSQASANPQKRAFSVNFSLNKYKSLAIQSPQQQQLQMSQGRPTSSLINKKAGLPQVFLEKYKKNGGALINSNQDGMGIGSNGKIFGNYNYEIHNIMSPNESLAQQNRQLQSAECILNSRQAFSEGAASRTESQGQVFGGSFQNAGKMLIPNTGFTGNVFSPPGGVRSLAIMNKAQTSMTQSIQHINAMGRIVNNGRTLQFDDSESLYNSQQINSGELKFFRNISETSQTPIPQSKVDNHIRQILENGPSQGSQTGTLAHIQKQMPPKAPSKRIQTSTLEPKPLRKPVISKKFFGKIFANCSPDARQNTASQGSVDNEGEPEMRGTSVFEMQTLGQPLRYDTRVNVESIISNGHLISDQQMQYQYPQVSKMQQYLLDSPFKDGGASPYVQGVEECSEFEREESAGTSQRPFKRQKQILFDQYRENYDNNNNYDDNYDNEENEEEELNSNEPGDDQLQN